MIWNMNRQYRIFGMIWHCVWKTQKLIPNWRVVLWLTKNQRIILYIGLFDIISTILLAFLITGVEEKHFDIYKSALFLIGTVLAFSQNCHHIFKHNLTRIIIGYYLFCVFFAITIYNIYFLYAFTYPMHEDYMKSWSDIIENQYCILSSIEFEVSTVFDHKIKLVIFLIFYFW